MLGVLTDREKAELLDALIAHDATLTARAGREARSRLAAVDIGDVAIAVAEELLGLDQEELSRHAGRTRYGYVEPTEGRGRCSRRRSNPGLRTWLGGRALDSTEQPVTSGSGFSRGYDKQGTAAATTSDCCRGRRTSRKMQASRLSDGSPPSASRCRSRRARHVIAPNVLPGDIDHPRRTLSGTVESPRCGCGGTHPDDRVVARPSENAERARIRGRLGGSARPCHSSAGPPVSGGVGDPVAVQLQQVVGRCH